jgi:hypothetical protein
VQGLEWEVLLAANRLGVLLIDDHTSSMDTYILDDTDNGDMLFGKLAAEDEHEPTTKGRQVAPKAAGVSDSQLENGLA